MAMNLNKIPLITLLIENTVYALAKDNRFDPVELKEIEDLKIRLDIIQSKTVLPE
jgi:AMMECR1 domain-containing protein